MHVGRVTIEINVSCYERWTGLTSEHEIAQDMETAAKDLQDVHKTVLNTTFNMYSRRQQLMKAACSLCKNWNL